MARGSDGSDEDRTLASALCTVGLSPQAQCCKETFPRSLSVPPHFLVSMRAQWALFEGKTPECSGDGSILRHLAHLLEQQLQSIPLSHVWNKSPIDGCMGQLTPAIHHSYIHQ